MRRASTALAESVTISQTSKIMNVAAAAEIYAKRQHLSHEAEQLANTVKCEALRKLGEMLQETPKATGARGVGPIAVPKENRNTPQTLAELGLTKKVSAIAQKLAALPDKAFQQVRDGHVTVAKAIAAVDAAKKPPPAVQTRQEPEQEAEQEVEDFGPSAEEDAYLAQRAEKFASELHVLLEANEPLKLATEKWKQAQSMVDTLQLRIHGLRNENAELVRTVKYWRHQAEKAAA
jgi:hypothetical protein